MLPQRITPELCQMLKKYQPIYVNTHFNHPNEMTPESREACERLNDAGIPVGNQSVLLRGINDCVHVMRKLVNGLVWIRVRPYYIYPVSYTHLDVYKRQVLNLPERETIDEIIAQIVQYS